MKRIALLVAVLGLLSEISGQEALKVPEGKEIWLNSAPGGILAFPDWLGKISVI
jgi:hypothetical protein